jgi:selenide,water dikinase
MFNSADHPDLLVGLGVPDDAAVYRLNQDQALVFTTDFFTPIVDDPYEYGLIAAANALSDVYAMGARPLLALNIAALPPNLPIEMIELMMKGMATKVNEAGAVIAGGHTIQDQEPKIGLAVVGMIHPERILAKSGAQPNDLLILTKPLGTGPCRHRPFKKCSLLDVTIKSLRCGGRGAVRRSCPHRYYRIRLSRPCFRNR